MERPIGAALLDRISWDDLRVFVAEHTWESLDSIVITDEPSACTAKIVHDFALRPSTRTVHAPH